MEGDALLGKKMKQNKMKLEENTTTVTFCMSIAHLTSEPGRGKEEHPRRSAAPRSAAHCFADPGTLVLSGVKLQESAQRRVF